MSYRNSPRETGGVDLFNLYVALSRSSGRETIRVLREFNDEDFQQQHDAELLEEDDRLELEDAKTRQWWERIKSQRRAERES